MVSLPLRGPVSRRRRPVACAAGRYDAGAGSGAARGPAHQRATSAIMRPRSRSHEHRWPPACVHGLPGASPARTSPACEARPQAATNAVGLVGDVDQARAAVVAATTSRIEVDTTGSPAARYSGVLVGLMYRVASLMREGHQRHVPAATGRRAARRSALPAEPVDVRPRGRSAGSIFTTGPIITNCQSGSARGKRAPAGPCRCARRSPRSSRCADAGWRPGPPGRGCGPRAARKCAASTLLGKQWTRCAWSCAWPRRGCAPPVNTRSARADQLVPRGASRPAARPRKPASSSMQS